ncbi:glycosyltransferase family 2 protein [Candidatus Protochlamydia phocaeensis]|uniref:glycosyltransferase family 2 protein n=1 Tax=Candidatus Protochlamydia phocaeensis TaxID=1414722 RepID=UPI0008399BB9|nr:glycosyltransferase family 2 protein [Candidatus Protochlamydia phocaeensis]
MTIRYSVVIPLKNEESNIAELIEELEPVMNQLNQPWELICIDDGSTDLTKQVLQKLAGKKTYLNPIFFKKNYGQSSAFDAGFKAARGDFVITLDGDRQNDPADIPKLIQEMADSDLVCGIRLKRKDPWHKRLISKMANKVRSRLCEDGVQDTGCSLKIYRSACLKQIKMYNGMHRFLPALFKIEGFRVSEVPVNHRERTSGKSNYNFFNRSLNTVADLLAVRWMKKRHLHYQIEKGASQPN